MKIAVCDDDKDYVESMVKKIRELDSDDRFSYMKYTPEGLLLDIEEDYFDSDIIIMDINLEKDEYDGIDIVKMVNRKYPACKIIFISNNVNYMEKTYETEHCFFIRKKYVEVLLGKALEKAVLESEEDTNSKVISVYSKRIKTFLKINDIMYVSRSGKNIIIYCNDGSKTVTKMSLSGFLKLVPDSPFVRVHGSFVVNLRFVKRFTTEEITLEKDFRHRENGRKNAGSKGTSGNLQNGSADEIKLPVGKTFLDSLQKACSDYCNTRM